MKNWVFFWVFTLAVGVGGGGNFYGVGVALTVVWGVSVGSVAGRAFAGDGVGFAFVALEGTFEALVIVEYVARFAGGTCALGCAVTGRTTFLAFLDAGCIVGTGSTYCVVALGTGGSVEVVSGVAVGALGSGWSGT